MILNEDFFDGFGEDNFEVELEDISEPLYNFNIEISLPYNCVNETHIEKLRKIGNKLYNSLTHSKCFPKVSSPVILSNDQEIAEKFDVPFADKDKFSQYTKHTSKHNGHYIYLFISFNHKIKRVVQVERFFNYLISIVKEYEFDYNKRRNMKLSMMSIKNPSFGLYGLDCDYRYNDIGKDSLIDSINTVFLGCQL